MSLAATGALADWPSCWAPIEKMSVEQLRDCQQVCTAVAAAMAKRPGSPAWRREHLASLRNIARIVKRIETLVDPHVTSVAVAAKAAVPRDKSKSLPESLGDVNVSIPPDQQHARVHTYLDELAVDVAPRTRNDVLKGVRALESFRLDVREPDNAGDDLDECVLVQYYAEWADLDAGEDLEPMIRSDRGEDVDAVSSVSCKTMMAASSTRFTTSRPSGLTLAASVEGMIDDIFENDAALLVPVEGIVQTEPTLPIVLREGHRASTTPQLSMIFERKGSNTSHRVTSGFATSIQKHLIKWSAALSSLPEWDDEAALVLELLRADATDFALPALHLDTG